MAVQLITTWKFFAVYLLGETRFGLIPSNPMENIKKCKFTRKKPKPFLQSEIALLLQQNKQEKLSN